MYENEDKKQIDNIAILIAVCGISLLVIIALLILFPIRMVETNHTGVLTRFGKVQEKTISNGLHILPPLTKVDKINNKIQVLEIKADGFSSDIQEVHIVYDLSYNILPENSKYIFENIGKKYEDNIITPKTMESIKIVLAKFTAQDLISKRTEVSKLIEEVLTEKISSYKINVSSASIRDIDFNETYTNAVEQKQVAEQNKLKQQTEAETKIIQAEAEARVRKIEAEGKASAKIIEAESISKANNLIKQSADEKVIKLQYIEKWNGVLPQVVGENSTILKDLK